MMEDIIKTEVNDNEVQNEAVNPEENLDQPNDNGVTDDDRRKIIGGGAAVLLGSIAYGIHKVKVKRQARKAEKDEQKEEKHGLKLPKFIQPKEEEKVEPEQTPKEPEVKEEESREDKLDAILAKMTELNEKVMKLEAEKES